VSPGVPQTVPAPWEPCRKRGVPGSGPARLRDPRR
jgi:hypothetical protein